MAEITASMVKELRERTGSGMMECKKALVETNGDLEAAVDLMRKKGMAQADKKASRVATEGTIAIAIADDKHTAVVVDVNSETDFVSKGEEFQTFANQVAQAALAHKPATLEALLSTTLESGQDVETRRRELIAKIGENITIRRYELIETSGVISAYKHGDKIGVLVDGSGDEMVLRDVAMHIAASRPAAISEADVDAALIEKEKEIFTAQAKESGKPDDIIEKMIVGRINKFLKEITLMNQPFVKNPDQTVAQMLKAADAMVERMWRLEVGEGIAKQEVNFAEEVAAQAAAMQK